MTEKKKEKAPIKTKAKEEVAEDYDLMLLHSPTEDGEGVRALRSRPGRLDFTELRQVEQGQDVSSTEVVSLTPRSDTPFVADVEVMYSPSEDNAPSTHAGPALVSSQSFRNNWDRIFSDSSKKPIKKQLLN